MQDRPTLEIGRERVRCKYIDKVEEKRKRPKAVKRHHRAVMFDYVATRKRCVQWDKHKVYTRHVKCMSCRHVWKPIIDEPNICPGCGKSIYIVHKERKK